MRADPAWQAARTIPRSQKQARATAFRALRERYGFSEYGLHAFAKTARVSWLADHLDAVLAGCASRADGAGSPASRTSATRRACTLCSRSPKRGKRRFLIWQHDQFPALIDRNDPVIKHGLDRASSSMPAQGLRKASSPQAKGADRQGSRYSVQLALEGVPYHKPKHTVGSEIIGADLGPSIIALVPRGADASISVFCEELAPDEKYQKTRQRKAEKERKLAAHRKSLHGRKVHEIVAVGNTVILEKISYKAWQKQYGKSVGLRAPGMPRRWIKIISSPRVPRPSFDARSGLWRGCGPPTLGCNNGRMKGSHCPEAWAVLVPEPVGLAV
jgi:hypothetical protein